MLEALVAKESTNEALEQWNKEACIPNAMTQTAVNHLYKVMLDKNLDQTLVLSFVSQLVRDDRNSINNTNCNEAFIKILNTKDNIEVIGFIHLLKQLFIITVLSYLYYICLPFQYLFTFLITLILFTFVYLFNNSLFDNCLLLG